LQKVSACSDPFAPTDEDTVRLWNIIQGMLDVADFNISQALEDFGTGMHQWCPILDEDMLLHCENDMSKIAGRYPLFILCMWLLMQRPCIHQKNMGATELYRAMKYIYVTLQIDGDVRVETVQVGMLIAIYEANLTISNCAIMLQILDLETSSIQINTQSRILGRLKSSLLRLDRYVCIMHDTHDTFQANQTYHS
jgi:hypothetical protein